MQYKTGTIKLLSGEATVEGLGTSWLTEVDPADLFKAKDEDVIYQVASVTNDTTIALSAPYTGSTRSGELYQINRDFTPNLNLPLIYGGDIDWPAFLNKTITLIDARINQSLLTTSSPTFAGITFTSLTGTTLNIDHLVEKTAAHSIVTNNHFIPNVDNTLNLGSALFRFANIYTADLVLANDRGNYRIIEEAEYLTVRNNKTGKLYKFVLEEVE